MAALPTIETLFRNYPNGTAAELAVLVGGTIGASITQNGWETCCVRLSRALNYSGVPIEGLDAISNPYMSNKKIRAQAGADGRLYIYSTYDLRAYLTGAHGPPIRYRGSTGAKDLPISGIIMFGFRHVDLWNGTRACNLALFGHSSALAHGVLLWPTPSSLAG